MQKINKNTGNINRRYGNNVSTKPVVVSSSNRFWIWFSLFLLLCLVATATGIVIMVWLNRRPLPKDYFSKKVECSTYNNKVKDNLNRKLFNSLDPNAIVPLTQEYYLLGFYSQKLNTCLYVSKVDGKYTIHDTLTNETIKTFSSLQENEYVKFINDYSGGETTSENHF